MIGEWQIPRRLTEHSIGEQNNKLNEVTTIFCVGGWWNIENELRNKRINEFFFGNSNTGVDIRKLIFN